jgi:hypothetical protein
MQYLKKLGFATAMALVMTCGVVSSASATTINPLNTAVSITSPNGALSIHGGGAVTCNDTTIHGRTPAVQTHTTWATITNVTLTFSGCTGFFLPATVTPNAACHTAGTAPSLHVMAVTRSSATAELTLNGCSIDVSIPSIGCTLTVAGPQTIGNGTTGAGGIQWTNRSPLGRADVNSALLPTVVSNGVGAGCSTAGHHTGTLTGTYDQITPHNVTITT